MHIHHPKLVAYLETHFLPVVDEMLFISYNLEGYQLDTCRLKELFGRAFTAQEHNGSGAGTKYDGWLVNLFPIIEMYSETLIFDRKEYRITARADHDLAAVRPSLAVVPIKMRLASALAEVESGASTRSAERDLVLSAGVFGAHAHPDGSLEAVHGYRVRWADHDL